MLVTTVLTFTRAEGGAARSQVQVAARTDPAASDHSVLGREVLEHFDLLVGRSRNEILLLAGEHEYHVQRV